MRRGRQFYVPVAALAVATMLAGSSTALATTGVASDDSAADLADLPVAIANPETSLDVIASLPEVVQQSDVMIADDSVPGSPIIYPDGTPVEGQSAEVTRAAIELRAAANCGGTFLAPMTPGWSTARVCGVAVFG